MPRAPARDLTDDSLALLYFAFREITDEPNRLLAARGFGRVHHRILYFIRRNPGILIGELRELLAVSKQALNAPLRELVARGLVESQRTPASGRTKRLSLTRAGSTFEEALSRPQREAFQRAFREVPPAGPRHWARIMDALGKHRAARYTGAP